MTLQKEIENVLSARSGGNIADCILAEYLTACLAAFNAVSNAWEKWYGPTSSSASAESVSTPASLDADPPTPVLSKADATLVVAGSQEPAKQRDPSSRSSALDRRQQLCDLFCARTGLSSAELELNYLLVPTRLSTLGQALDWVIVRSASLYELCYEHMSNGERIALCALQPEEMARQDVAVFSDLNLEMAKARERIVGNHTP